MYLREEFTRSKKQQVVNLLVALILLEPMFGL